MSFQSAADYIEAETGKAPVGDYLCKECSRRAPAWALYMVDGDSGAICGHCLSNRAANAPALESPSSWESEAGNAIRAERNRLLNEYAWTVQRGSPLSATCQAAFEAFIVSLHRVTVEAQNPGEVEWPQVPDLEFQEK